MAQASYDMRKRVVGNVPMDRLLDSDRHHEGENEQVIDELGRALAVISHDADLTGSYFRSVDETEVGSIKRKTELVVQSAF